MSFDFSNFARFASPLLLSTIMLLQINPSVRAETVPTFTIVDPDIGLDPGQSSGRRAILLSGENLEAANIGKPLEDIAGLETGFAGSVKFSARDLDHTDTSRRWLLTVDIDGLPNNVVQKRYLAFRFDGKTTTLPFTLNNKNPATFVWSVKGPSEINLPPGEPIEIGVAVQSGCRHQNRGFAVIVAWSSHRNGIRSKAVGCCARNDPVIPRPAPTRK